MREIILEKRYPHSREEDITDAFMRGYVKGKADRPKGKWIKDAEWRCVCKCSVCGAEETDFIYGTEMWYGLGESKFCPNCGADMRGEDNETD